MSRRPPPRLPSGRPPWDPLNGLRVGAFVGGTLGVIATAALGLGYIWVVLVSAVVGAGLGYWTEKRKQRITPESSKGTTGAT